MNKQLFLPSETHTINVAKKMAAYLSAPLVLTFRGEIGAGKTTFIRALLQAFGINAAIKSPTFSLVESYVRDDCHLHHFDLYRIDDEAELDYIGFRDYFTLTSICLIEWPEQAPHSLADVDAAFEFIICQTGRELKMNAMSAAGERLLHDLRDE